MFIIMPLAMLACFAMSFCSMPDEPRSPMIDRMGSADMGKGGGE